MAPILTPGDVVRRIAAECTFVNERGGVGIRLKPAAAIVRQYGQQFRAPRRQRRQAAVNRRLCSEWPVVFSSFFLHLTFATPNRLNRLAQENPQKS
ncbi:MAG TPA: hypothetical protein VHT68_04810 [Pseudolabrys sp.]|nr:hypothetical protein [Pseudolabrys sp.]